MALHAFGDLSELLADVEQYRDYYNKQDLNGNHCSLLLVTVGIPMSVAGQPEKHDSDYGRCNFHRNPSGTGNLGGNPPVQL